MESNTTTPQFDNHIFTALIPVLVQCFGLILLGFLAGKFKILTDAQAKGLGVYVTTFALPAIFFTVGHYRKKPILLSFRPVKNAPIPLSVGHGNNRFHGC